MRTLILLRGTPGSGKSTWLKKKGLMPYVLSADTIRLLYKSPAIDSLGNTSIDQSTNRDAWKTLFEILEKRMSIGEFTIIDACNSKTSEMNLYKSLAEKYRYRIYCVDFTDIPIEKAKKWNKKRPKHKWVSDESIDLYYSRFATQKIPSGIKVINRKDFEKEVYYRSIDLSKYESVKIIGDIHGCYSTLKNAIGEIEDNTFYIFLGDYLDRGIQNKETLDFLMSIKDKENVCLLEGNHEKHLWAYGNDLPVQSKEFMLRTKDQIKDFDKKEIRKFYRKLHQCILFDFDKKQYFCSHGGISTIKQNLVFTPTCDFIDGVGDYEDIYTCEKTFKKTTPNIIQIHGHRNPNREKIEANENNFNLEGQVEFGGGLRVVELHHNNKMTLIEVTNPFHRVQEEKTKEVQKEETKALTVANLITTLRTNKKTITEKQFGNISSFNFTKNAFYEKNWNDLTVKARGLFLNTKNNTVANRAYEKFFNIGEVKETELGYLSTHLNFPLKCYVKYNGFLGLLGYDADNDKLLFCSKSNVGGNFSKYFEDIFMEKYGDRYQDILNYVKENNVSLVFEVIDPVNDPHIIKYDKKDIVLLDIVNREIRFKNAPYSQLCEFADKLHMSVKKEAYTINSWADFLVWYNDVLEEDYTYQGNVIEGFVIVDGNNFMTKLKLDYYKFWKQMRYVADQVMHVGKNGNRKGYIDRTSSLTTAKANLFYGFLRKLCEEGYEGKTDIITLRDLWNEENEKV